MNLTPLNIEILAGPHAGQTIRFTDAVISLGRAEDNTIVIDLPFISRNHAEFHFTSRGWELVNHSPNGTRMGNRLVQGNRQPFNNEQTITIGNMAVLRVMPVAVEESHEDGALVGGSKGDAARHPLNGGLSGRTKLWIGIGIYLAIMFALFIFFATLSHTNNNTATIAQLTVPEIIQQIRQTPSAHPPDPRLAAEALTQATAYFHARDAQVDALFRAYRAYRRAASYSPGHTLAQPLDQGRYQSVRHWLIQRIAGDYEQAMTYLHDGHYDRAVAALRHLAQSYPDYNSPLFTNIQQHLARAKQLAANHRT